MKRDLLGEVQTIGDELDELRKAAEFIGLCCDELHETVPLAGYMPAMMSLFQSKIEDIDFRVGEVGNGLLLERIRDTA